MIGVLIALGALALLVSSTAEQIDVTVAEADDGTFHFLATQGGKVIFEDGPFATKDAAQLAADNWLAAKKSKPVALGCAGSGAPCRAGVSLGFGPHYPGARPPRNGHGGGYLARDSWEAGGGSAGLARARVNFRTAQLGEIGHGTAGIIAPYKLTTTPNGIAIDIRDLHGMLEWARSVAPEIGIRDRTMAGMALRKLAAHLVGRAPIAAINFGNLGDDSWIDVLKYVRANIRPFTWTRLVEVAHARLHQLGLASLAETGIGSKLGVWRRKGKAPGGFTAQPGVPVPSLDLGSCGEYEGNPGHWWICCKDDDGRYTCSQITHGDPWTPSKRGAHAFKVALGQNHGGGAHRSSYGGSMAERGTKSRAPGPGETGVNAAGGLYVRTRGERRL